MRREPQHREVFITVGPENTLVYRCGGQNAWTLRVGRGDTVTWLCDAGPFAVVFGERSPFNRTVFAVGLRESITATVPQKRFSGIYPYSIVVFRGDSAPIVDDPEVLVGEVAIDDI
jgi:plastocyanin